MKSQVRLAALLLPLLLDGCFHSQNQAAKQPPLAPPIQDSPLPKPNNAPVNLPPPVVTVPQPKPAPPATTAQQEPPPPKPAPRHKKTQKPAPAPPAQQQATGTGTPEVSAIGQLTPAQPANLKKETSDSIADTEKGLNGISRQLNDQEQKTGAQIREFLKQAKAALGDGDVDGAHTLALKAKVLLSELNQ